MNDPTRARRAPRRGRTSNLTRAALAMLVALAACEVEPSDTAQSPPPPLPAQLTAGTAVRGESLWVTVRGAAPFASIDLAGGPGLGDGLCPTPVGSLCLDLVGARLLASGTADAAGVFHGNLPLPAGLGRQFVDYYVQIKRAELARYDLEVSEWEQREYFEMF